MGKKVNKAKRGKDKYYQLAKEQGYRARSAFKLIQLNKKYDFLAKATVCIDLCAAPGGWLQVAAKYMPSASTIIGVDLMPIKPIRGVISHREDITTPQCRTLLKRDLAGKKADVILHDGAPNVGQNWQKDAFTQSELVLCSLKLATEFLKPHGLFITKVFRSADYNSLLWVFHQLFGKVEATKPHSSRNASAEIFVACRDYKAPDRIDPRLLDPRYVFKEVADTTGTATGLAGGGGGGTVDVLHKKSNDKKVRQREGYDASLGPLLTRNLPVSAFIRSADPVRTLTDASAFVFDAEAEQLGYSGHAATTDAIRTACADLKVLGKKDFKDLLKWRVTLRRSLPNTLIRKARRGADKEEEGEGEGESDEGEKQEQEDGIGSDGSGSDGGDDSDSDSSDDEGQHRELSAAAAAELRRRKREKKREAKVKAKTLRRQRLGMNLRSVDLLSTEENLFDLATVRRLAARADAEGDGTGAEVIDSLVADVDLHDATRSGAQSGVGTVIAPIEDGYGSDSDGGEGDSDVDMGSGSEDEVGGGDVSDDASDDGSVIERLRQADVTARLDDLEEDMDRAYALFLAKRERRASEAKSRFDAGRASAGIKLTRRAKLEQQAVMTQAALEGKLDAEHQKYLRMLAGARAASTADGSASGSVAAASAGVKRKRGDDDVSDHDSEDIDSSDDDYEEEGAAEARAGGRAGEDGDQDDVDDVSDADDDDDEKAEAAPSLPVKASRWFSQPLFAGSGALGGAQPLSSSRGGGGLTAGAAGALRLPSAAAAPAAAKQGKKASAAAAAEDPFSDDSDSNSDGDDAMSGQRRKAVASSNGSSGKEGKKAKQSATDRHAAAAYRAGVKGGKAEDEGNAGYDSDGDIDPLANLPKSERDRWKDRLKKRRERAEAATARRAAKDDMEIVQGAEDAGDDEFSSAVARTLGGSGGGADDDSGDDEDVSGERGKKGKKKGVRFADDGDSVTGGGSDGDDVNAPLDPKVKAKRDLIRRGMGAALSEEAAAASEAAAHARGGSGAISKKRLASAGSGFEVVRGANDDDDVTAGDAGAAGDGASDGGDSGPDPRDADYDSDTHAELLALGKLLKRHTTAKALADASYNRYAFDDAGELPAWFKHDEARHFKPQLPLSKQDVDVSSTDIITADCSSRA